MNVKIVVLGRELHELPGLMDGRLTGTKRKADHRLHRIELRHRQLCAGDGDAAVIDFFIAQAEGITVAEVFKTKKFCAGGPEAAPCSPPARVTVEHRASRLRKCLPAEPP